MQHALRHTASHAAGRKAVQRGRLCQQATVQQPSARKRCSHLRLPVEQQAEWLRMGVTQAASSAGFFAAASREPPGPEPAHLSEFNSTAVQPDLVLEAPGLKRRVQVFGVRHTSSASALGGHILRTRPAAVVVETAVTPEHGARPGNRISCQDRLLEGPAAFFMRVFCQVAAKMKEEAEQYGGDVTATNMWKQATSNAFRGEQLVYVAALACDAPLVFGDRPKDITYRRLYTLASAADLDEGYGRQAAINYLEMLGRPPLPASDLDEATTVERISMQEREAVMCSVAHDTAAMQEGGTQDVVMVVGSAHVSGIEKLWAGGKWRVLLNSDSTHDSPILRAPPLDSVSSKEVGLRRGLLTSLLRMSATREVLVDLEQTLGVVSERHQQTFAAVCEIYGSTRTMLACLDKQLLGEVCQGLRDAATGVQQDLWRVLEPIRAIRPSNGGRGHSEDMVTYIRALNFDLD